MARFRNLLNFIIWISGKSINNIVLPFHVEIWQCRTMSRSVHSFHIHIRSEHDDFTAGASICFHPFEQLDRVVKGWWCRVLWQILSLLGTVCTYEAQISKFDNFGSSPSAVIRVKINFEHMIREDVAKWHCFRIFGFCLLIFTLFNDKVACFEANSTRSRKFSRNRRC